MKIRRLSAKAKNDGDERQRRVKRSASAPSKWPSDARGTEEAFRKLREKREWRSSVQPGASTVSLAASTLTSDTRLRVVKDDDDGGGGKWVVTLDPPLRTEDRRRSRGRRRSLRLPPSSDGREENEDHRAPRARRPVRDALSYFFASPLCVIGLFLVLLARYARRSDPLKVLPFLALIKMAEVLTPWADFVANSPTAVKLKSATCYLNRKLVEYNEPPPDPDAAWRSVDLYVVKAFLVKAGAFAAKGYNRRSSNVAASAQSSMGNMLKSFKPGNSFE